MIINLIKIMKNKNYIRNLKKLAKLTSTYSLLVITKYKGDYTQLI